MKNITISMACAIALGLVAGTASAATKQTPSPQVCAAAKEGLKSYQANVETLLTGFVSNYLLSAEAMEKFQTAYELQAQYGTPDFSGLGRVAEGYREAHKNSAEAVETFLKNSRELQELAIECMK